jgi:hypothetical protein
MDIIELAATSLIGRKPSPRVYRAHFGISFTITCMIWDMILHSDLQWDVAFNASHLLWALYYLKVYPSWDVAVSFCQADAKTCRKYIELIIHIVLPDVLPIVSVLLLQEILISRNTNLGEV